MSESELDSHESTKPVSVFASIVLGKRGERNNACSAAGHVKDENFAKLWKGAVRIDFEFCGAPALSELPDGT